MKSVAVDVDKLQRVVHYIGGAQPRLRKLAAIEAAVAKQASTVLDALVTQGVLSEHLKAAKLREITDKPETMLSLLKAAAAQVRPAAMGAGTGDAAGSKPLTANDAFDRKILGV